METPESNTRNTLDLLDNINEPTRYRLEFTYQPAPEFWCDSFYYSAARPDNNGMVVDIPFCSGSDYSGSLMEKANYKAIDDQMTETPEDELWPIYYYSGGYGTFGIVLILDVEIPEDMFFEIEELLDHLRWSRIIDEDIHSELVTEAQDEAVREFVRWDLQRHELVTDEDAETIMRQRTITLERKAQAAMRDVNDPGVQEQHHWCLSDEAETAIAKAILADPGITVTRRELILTWTHGGYKLMSRRMFSDGVINERTFTPSKRNIRRYDMLLAKYGPTYQFGESSAIVR